MNDVKIGTGSHGIMATRIFLFGSNSHFSDNAASYWIEDVIGSIGMIVMKDTKLGKQIEADIQLLCSVENLKKGDPTTLKIEERILTYCRKILLENLDPDTLLSEIENMTIRAYDKGKRDNQNKIREALGIYQ